MVDLVVGTMPRSPGWYMDPLCSSLGSSWSSCRSTASKFSLCGVVSEESELVLWGYSNN